MTFNESVQAMLDGKKVTRVNPAGHDYHGYIVLDADGDTVDSNGNQVILSKRDFVADWEIASVPAAGTLLTHYGKDYWLIKETDGNYAVIDKETCVEQIKGIPKKNLMRDLIYYNFGIVKTHKIN